MSNPTFNRGSIFGASSSASQGKPMGQPRMATGSIFGAGSMGSAQRSEKKDKPTPRRESNTQMGSIFGKRETINVLLLSECT